TIAREFRVRRIAVHRRKFPRRAHRGWTYVTILLDILAVQAARHRQRGRARQLARKRLAPAQTVCDARRRAQVAELIAEIPRFDRLVSAKVCADRASREALCIEQRSACVEVADSPWLDLARRNGAKAWRRRSAIERPARKPIHAAHVSAEERRHSTQTVLRQQLE